MTKNNHRPLVLGLLAFTVSGSLLVGLGAGAVTAHSAIPSVPSTVSEVAPGAPLAQPCDIDPANVIKYFKDSAGSYPWAPVILGHRGLFGKYDEAVGGSRDVPENSLASMQSASNACLEGVEMDVRASSNAATPVIMHDSTVGRTTNVFDPRIVPEGQTPPSGDLLERMKQNILAAQGTNYPPNMDPVTKHDLEANFDARNAFSPYGEISQPPATPTIQPIAGTTYGRNPKVIDLSPETLTNLRLLKYQDPAPAPTINHDGTFGPSPSASDVSTEKVQTVQSLLAYAAENQIKSAIIFDVIERESLNAIAKILSEDTHTFINGRKAKDIAVIKYRGKLESDVSKLMTELKNSAVSSQYPQGFYPNLIGIVAKYFDQPGGFDSVKYVEDWIKLRKDQPDLPLVSLDTVVTSPDEGASLDLVAKERTNNITIGSFHDVPSYRGGSYYPQELVDKRLYFLSDGRCCRSTDSTGDPQGTQDKRYDYSWMIAGNTSNSVPSGMITSDDPMPIIKTLEALSLRKKALNAYKTRPVGEYDGKYNQLFNVASEKTLGVGGTIVDGPRADQQNDNFRKNNIWAFEWITGNTYRIKLLQRDAWQNDQYLTNEKSQVSVNVLNPSREESQFWTVRQNPAEGFLTLESLDPLAPGALAFEGDSWKESAKAITTTSVWSTQKWQIRPLDAIQDLPMNPGSMKKLNDQESNLRITADSNDLLTTDTTGVPFIFSSNGDGSYKLVPSGHDPVRPKNCASDDGTELYADQALGHGCDDWLIIKKPASYQRLMFFNLYTGKVMDTSSRPQETTRVSLWESNGTNKQAYFLAN